MKRQIFEAPNVLAVQVGDAWQSGGAGVDVCARRHRGKGRKGRIGVFPFLFVLLCVCVHCAVGRVRAVYVGR